MPVLGRRGAARAAVVLSRARRCVGTGPSAAALMVVAVFGLVAAVLLARTWADTRGVSSDLSSGISPQLTAAHTDPAVAELLRRTGELTEDFAVGLLPIGASMGRAADSTTEAVRDAEAIRDHTRSTTRTLADLDASATSIRALVSDWAPLIVSAVSATRDISTHFDGAQRQTRQTAGLLENVLGHVGGMADDARSLRARTEAIEAELRRIERHGSRIASADALDCPSDLRSCLP